jgi:hypothetical protein
MEIIELLLDEENEEAGIDAIQHSFNHQQLKVTF